VFPSVKDIEVYNVAAREFQPATDITGQITELQTARGRGEHLAVRVAGFDNRLSTADDIVLFGSGYQTLSGVFAPQTKFPGFQGQSNQTSLEFFDLETGIVATAPNISLLPHLQGGGAFNVGQYANTTPDGVEGVSNVALFFNGSDAGSGCANWTATSELISCSYTGFGPGSGIQFFETNPTLYLEYTDPFVSRTMNPDWIGAVGGSAGIGAHYSDGVMVPNRRTYDGVVFNGNWGFSAGGNSVFIPPTGGCAEPTAPGFGVFDPFFDILNIFLDNTGADGNFSYLGTPPDLDDMPAAWDQTTTRTVLTPTGVFGTWFFAQDKLPDDHYFVDNPGGTGSLRKNRIMHTMTTLPGEDGVVDTPDDRILIVGGGTIFYDNFSLGGEPIGGGCEVYLPTGANGP
ncbi:MAG: hypothetical protein KDC38_18925, partial [Planctomycetes bacterium]|nr:hypothetical protein [Planctomycetota bacterium]